MTLSLPRCRGGGHQDKKGERAEQEPLGLFSSSEQLIVVAPSEAAVDVSVSVSVSVSPCGVLMGASPSDSHSLVGVEAPRLVRGEVGSFGLIGE